jgi:RHS repeat-associated protein
VQVTIDWCGYYPTLYDEGTRIIRLNGQDVSGSFTTENIPFYSAACGWPGEESDNIASRSTGTISLQPGANILYAEIRSWDNYAGADQETYTRPDPTRTVAVSSNNQYVEVRASQTGLAQTYTVWNTGSVQDTFTISTVCSGQASSCVVTPPTSLVLAAGATATSTVTYNSGSTVGATGLVWLKAWKTSSSGIRDSSWTEITVTSAPAAGVVLVQTPDVLERDLCVTIAAGSNSAYECGDLRIVHGLPVTRTRNTPRAPTLLYNSQHASPFPLVAANVTLPTAIPTPDSVTAVLRIGGVIFSRGRWPGTNFPLGWATRVVVGFAADTFSTSVYAYTLEVTRWSGGTGTNVATPTGQLLIVNRRTSPFGAGWWVAGLEQIYFPADGSRFWVGGDGSIRRYVSAGTNVWAAVNVDRPDTLKWDAFPARYVRYLRNGLRVYFDAQGRHIETTNRLSQKTQFAYDGSGRLATIALPPAGSGKVYTFAYNTSTTRLDSIIAPPTGTSPPVPPPGARATKVTITGGRITAIRDADLVSTTFSYGTGADSNRIVGRTNRRGFATRFGYDTAKRLAADSVPLTASAYAISNFKASESRGFSASGGSGTAIRADTVYTQLDGPRTDVGDVTKFWLNAHGAPTRIRNALGRETRVIYDGTWPALAARTIGPNLFETKAYYNSRGLLDSTVALNPLGTGANAKAQYRWDGTWDMATSVRSPTGVFDTVSYNAANGNRLWQQRGTDAARRVTFTYYTSGAASGLVATVTAPLTPAESVFYNNLGNLYKTRTPIGFLTLVYSDAAGRDTLVRSPIDSATAIDSASVVANGTWTRTIYDILSRPTATTTWGPARTGVSGTNAAADSVRVETQYDGEGNPTSIMRRFRSNGANVALQSTATFDRANRDTLQTSPSGGTTRRLLDAAGNDTATITPRGHSLRASFDALNRVIQQAVPQVGYSSLSCYLFIQTGPLCFFSFPTRDGPDVCLRADTATFGYDHSGNLVRADNWAARVRRSYTPAGLLKHDTLRTRTYYYASGQPCELPPPSGTALGWDAHVYPVSFDYDLDGRRTRIWHPSAVSPCGGCNQQYFYNPVLGTLDSLTEPLGNKVRFTYDYAGRRTAALYPASWTETLTYDADSRVTLRTVTAPGSGSGISDQMAYDALGRVRGGTDAGGYTIKTFYGPLGAVIGDSGMVAGAGTEEFVVDGIGNRTWRRQLGIKPGHPDVNAIRVVDYDATGRMSAMRDTVQQSCTPQPGCDTYKYRQDQGYDAAGNTHTTWSSETDYHDYPQVELLYDQAVSYYGADQRLRVFDRMIGFGPASDDQRPGQRGVYEEYRYDALGRRVLSRSRRDAGCPVADAECSSHVERTIWDGDQVLYEIRARGHDTTAANNLENDQESSTSAEGYAWGRVVYAHAGGIDQPLAIIRTGMSGQPSPWLMFPHANWRGSFAGGSQLDGSWSGPGGLIPWPGRATTADGETGQPAQQLSWFGNLISGKTDGSGLQYMRNRYYDPRTGRFTQEDPIGLAGGLNLYGFASGDPVTFSDPFGLSDCRRPKTLMEAFVCVGVLLQPIEKPLEIAGIVVTAPLGGGMGMMGRAGGVTAAVGVGSRVGTLAVDVGGVVARARAAATTLPGRIFALGREVSQLRLGSAGASELLEQGLNRLGAEFTKTTIQGATHFVAGAPRNGLFNAFRVAESGEVIVAQVRLVRGAFQVVQ